MANGTQLFNDEGKIGITKESLGEYWKMWKQLLKEGVTIPPRRQAEEPGAPSRAMWRRAG